MMKKCTVCGKGWMWPKEGCKTCASMGTRTAEVRVEAATTTAQSNMRQGGAATRQATGGGGNNATSGPPNTSSMALGLADPVAVHPRRGSLTADPVPQANQGGPPQQPTPNQAATTQGVTPTSTTATTPVINTTQQRAQKNQRLKDALAIITGGTDPERQQRATATADHVMRSSPEQLAARSPEENVQALAALTSVNVRVVIDATTYQENVPPTMKAALAKLYENMALDPDFENQDRGQRDAILGAIANDPAAQNLAEADWVPGYDEEDANTSETRLRQLQALQKQHLPPGMFGPGDQLTLEASLDGDQSGVCRGKQVAISGDTDVNHSFDETLNTVVHETTHAYQKHLENTVDTMSLDDPRYVQAQLFKFNSKGYAEPPDKPDANASNAEREEYERLYAAYKNQPTERHAWQAGNEAGRLFDARAGALTSVQTAVRIGRFSPGAAEEAQGLAGQIGNGSNQAKAAAMLDLEVLAERAVGQASTAIAAWQRDDVCLTYIGADRWNAFESRRVNVLNDRRSKPATRLATLETLMAELERAYEEGRVRAGVEAQIDAVSTAMLTMLNDPKAVTYLGESDWDFYEGERDRMVESQASVDSRLRVISNARDGLARDFASGREAYERTMANNTEFERLWGVLTRRALPDPVANVARSVQNLNPREDAIARLRASQAVRDYFAELGETL